MSRYIDAEKFKKEMYHEAFETDSDMQKWAGNCEECMKDAPYEYCCKLECGEHEFCRGCQKAGYLKKWR